MTRPFISQDLKLAATFVGMAVVLPRCSVADDDTNFPLKELRGAYKVVKVIRVLKKPPIAGSWRVTDKIVLGENSIAYYDENDRLLCRDGVSNLQGNKLQIEGERETFGASGEIRKSPLIPSRLTFQSLGSGLFMCVIHYDDKNLVHDLTSVYAGDLIHILKRTPAPSPTK